ncbi:MAG: poly-beta-1,6-N-acetyl-D-glucosamine biosynthesis protein PgaD [Nevskia sp.]|nr:poly-beta-1,6-N-acetyl-D-glucosamine biosynthesis protein PgaD [Nevskia sp.]
MNEAELYIDDSRYLPVHVRLLEAGVTVLLWLAYLGLLSPVASTVWSYATLHGDGSRPVTPSQEISVAGFGRFLAHVYTVVLVNLGLLLFWARHNVRRFRGRSRRKNVANVSEQQLAKFFHVECGQVAVWQQSRRLLMHHDVEGHLLAVETGQPVASKSCGAEPVNCHAEIT